MPLPGSFIAPNNPFTEGNSTTGSIPLSLYLNNIDQDAHKNFGILRSGNFNERGYFGMGPQNTWLDLGIAPQDFFPFSSYPSRYIIPDDWGFKTFRNSVSGSFGIRETKDCEDQWQNLNPVLSWATREHYTSEESAKLMNFYIDHYSDFDAAMSYKKNIMKLMRNGNVGIGLPTYSTNPCSGAGGSEISYTRNPSFEQFPQNTLDIEGAMAVGIGYSGAATAPSNGLLVQGQSGFGLSNPSGFMHVYNDDVNIVTLISEHNTTDDFGYNVLAKNGDASTKAFASQMVGSSSDDFVVLATGQSSFATSINPSYTMTINGSGSINSAWVVSDQKFKQNIKPISNSLDLIMKIRGVRYNYIPESKRTITFEGKTTEIKMNFDYDKSQIGYIAQELELIVPELVKTDENGYKAVNYCQMVALLTEGIKEQQNEIEVLQAEVENLKAASILKNENSKIVPSGNNTDTKLSWLKQNNPNPFSQNSTIEMYINLSSKDVSLRVYDLTGVQLKTFTIESRGYFNLPISADSFKPGQYLYSLIIDGKEIDTKKMVILD